MLERDDALAERVDDVLVDGADLPAQVRDVAAAERADVLAVDLDAAGRGRLGADEEPDDGRLPGAALTDEEDEVTGGDAERHVRERARAVRVLHAHVVEDDHVPSIALKGLA